MEDERSLKKVLKWLGLVALVAVPLAVFLKKRKTVEPSTASDDDSDIFLSELQE